MGSSTPIIPVDATATESKSRSKAFDVIKAISLASIKPCSPTEVFAQPELATIALIFPLSIVDLVQVTEGETIEFCVKVPALTQLCSEYIIPIYNFYIQN